MKETGMDLLSDARVLVFLFFVVLAIITSFNTKKSDKNNEANKIAIKDFLLGKNFFVQVNDGNYGVKIQAEEHLMSFGAQIVIDEQSATHRVEPSYFLSTEQSEGYLHFRIIELATNKLIYNSRLDPLWM